jgi:group I intron endonuclease
MGNGSYGLVYKATSIIDGKIYVGQTIVGLKTRRECHVNAALAERDNNYFHNSIRKHGKDNFEWEIIGYANSKSALDDLEIYYIKELKSFEKGYNLTEGGGGMTNYVMTEEHRKNLSESHKGYKHTDEQRRKISKSLTGRPVSEYTRKLQMGKNNPHASAIIINCHYFDTRKEAAEFLGVTPALIRYRILHKTKWSGYHYA